MTVTEKLKEISTLEDGFIVGQLHGIVGPLGLTIQWICGAGKLEQRFEDNDKVHITHILFAGGVRLGFAGAVIDPELFKGLEIKTYIS
jgi:hypothetical protein